MPSPSAQSSPPSISQLQSLLRAFTNSRKPYKHIQSIPSPPTSQVNLSHSTPTSASDTTAVPSSTLLILDSSFNPPTKAHAYLVREAVRRYSESRRENSYTPGPGSTPQTPPRILLLLSTRNADKLSIPAAVEQRLWMMGLFARGLWRELTDSSTDAGSKSGSRIEAASSVQSETRSEAETQRRVEEDEHQIAGIDIAITTEPRFLEKSLLLSGSGTASSNTAASEDDGDKRYQASTAQWHLLGYDTLVRLLDGKYYPPSGSLDVLAPLFEAESNKILVVRREMDGKGEDGDEQERFVKALSVDSNERGFGAEGWNVEWGGKIELVAAYEGIRDGEGEAVKVSSTAVRKAAKEKDEKLVRIMCGDVVGEYVLNEKLYLED